MAHLHSIVDNKGRINHQAMKAFIANISLSEFIEQSHHPFLIGKELYDGELRKKLGPAGSTSTMKFQAADIKESMSAYAMAHSVFSKRTISEDTPPPSAPDVGGISNAIYCLKKNGPGDPMEFSIGRAEDNDIVIADYVISKHHAKISIFRDMYFVVDLKSTNGTKVNDHLITPGMKVQLNLNSTIAFGRFCFIFTHPLQVYRGMRKEILGVQDNPSN